MPFTNRAKLIVAHFSGLIGSALFVFTQFMFTEEDYKLTKITFIIG